jgi:phosphoglycerol transferase MdoB-like AlkP superfamily enzyme
MFGLGERIGMLLIASALLFAALRVHKSSGKHRQITSYAGVALAFLAGCGFLGTLVGSWMGRVASWAGVIGVVSLIACVVILVVDIAFDKRPDKPAFWAALILPLAIVFGTSQIPNVTTLVEGGADQVGRQVQQMGQ